MGSLSTVDVVARLGAAVLVGALIGLDRELRGKPAGLRTVALVALGSALFVLTAYDSGLPDARDATSRVIQGIVTGIGFLGAGTIVRGHTEQSVTGLTTAASVWLAAGSGVACGLGQWTLVITSTGLGVMILVIASLDAWLKERRTKHR